jgi:hypothetical protein
VRITRFSRHPLARDPNTFSHRITEETEETLPRKKFANSVIGQNDTDGLPNIPLVGKLRHPIEIGQEDMPRPETVLRDKLHALI